VGGKKERRKKIRPQGKMGGSKRMQKGTGRSLGRGGETIGGKERTGPQRGEAYLYQNRKSLEGGGFKKQGWGEPGGEGRRKRKSQQNKERQEIAKEREGLLEVRPGGKAPRRESVLTKKTKESKKGTRRKKFVWGDLGWTCGA